MKNAIVAVTACWLLACAGAPLRAKASDSLVGTWRAPCQANPPDQKGQVSYGQAQFTYGDTGQGAFQYTIYGDAACSFKLAAFLLESDITVGRALPSVGPGAYEMDVKYRKLSATASVDGLAQGFLQAGCGSAPWKIGVTQDISTTGCFNFKPLSQCPADYDVAKVNGDHFFNGAREADMCVVSGRPTKLAGFAFERASK